MNVERTAKNLATQIARVPHEVLTIPADWVVEYGEYQSGGWYTRSLLNDSGDPCGVTIHDCKPMSTTLLGHMRQTRQTLDSLAFQIMWVRFARLAANSFVWEHRDDTELEPVERYRLVTAMMNLIKTTLVLTSTVCGWYQLPEKIGITPIGRTCLDDFFSTILTPPIRTNRGPISILDQPLTITEPTAPVELSGLTPAVTAHRHYLEHA